MRTGRTFLCGLAVVVCYAPLGRAAAHPPIDDWSVAGDRRRTGPESDYFSALQMIGRVTGSRAVVNLVTSANLSAAVQARVRWAETPDDLPASQNVSPVVGTADPWARLELEITGLQPDRKYFYQVQFETTDDPGVWMDMSNIGEFSSQKSAGQSFSFCVLADPHWGAWTVPPGSPRRWTADQCLLRILEDEVFDFCLDLGDSPYPVEVFSAAQALTRYRDYRSAMAEIAHRMPVFLALGNHENEAGFYQRGTNQFPAPLLWNRLCATQYHQKWNTEARLRFIPNPRGDTYPEGGEGAPGYDTAADWGAGTDPWNDGINSNIQNFYAWTWGDALFIVLDPFRYTLVGSVSVTNSPSQWTLGTTQMQWLQDVLTASTARWKFIIAHHQVGGGLIDVGGCPIQDGGTQWAYARGSAVEADRPGTEQALIHQLMLQHGVRFFVYAHDHTFCHSVKDGIHYLCCGRPTCLEPWWAQQGMLDSYGNIVVQGRDKPWIKALYNVLGYTRFRITPDTVTMEWIRTGYSFTINSVYVQYAHRDWYESWLGKTYPVDEALSATVGMVPSDVDAVRTPPEATLSQVFQVPTGDNFYVQPVPVRPEYYTDTQVPIEQGFPLQPRSPNYAVVDTVPEQIYRRVWFYRGDSDDDGDRDLADYGAMQTCCSPQPGSVPPTHRCADMDLDADEDVDADDLAELLSDFPGPT